MRIKEVQIENFRLLRDVAVGLEDRTTLIVGRNNSGKTSIAELFRRLLGDKVPSFRIEDFSLGSHECFWTAFEAMNAAAATHEVVALLPSIKITIDITYDIDAPDLGPLSDCIVDLDPDCSDARLVLTYGPRPTAPGLLFTDIAVGDDVGINRLNLFRALGSRVQAAYAASLEAVDPNDPTNRKSLEPKTLTALVRGGGLHQCAARPR